jgi:N-succinyldiaminopimelate aminotransferase
VNIVSFNANLDLLQPYPFERLRTLHEGITHKGTLQHISLSIGEPKHNPPKFVIDELSNAVSLAKHLATYPATKGSDALRTAIAQWLKRRFAVTVNPDLGILPVNGTREALFSVAQALLSGNKDSLVAMPNPFYQIYEGAALLAGAQPLYIPNLVELNYKADFSSVSPEQWRKTEMVYMCSPGNPTGQIMQREQMQWLIELAQEYDFNIVSDECYAELYYDDDSLPESILAAAHAMGLPDFDRCLAFHSLSKRSNLPGLRSGFVAGDPNLIEKYLSYRTYHGCALGAHHQAASALAWQDEAHVVENRQLYSDKFRAVSEILSPHYNLSQPEGGFYHWLPTPICDQEFSQRLLAEQHITVMPGSFLGRDTPQGNPGNNHARIAWVAPFDECIQAAQRLAAFAQNL